MIGAVIHLGAGNRTLTMQGHTWNLLDLDRHQVTAVAQLVSETAGIRAKGRKAPRSRSGKPTTEE